MLKLKSKSSPSPHSTFIQCDNFGCFLCNLQGLLVCASTMSEGVQLKYWPLVLVEYSTPSLKLLTSLNVLHSKLIGMLIDGWRGSDWYNPPLYYYTSMAAIMCSATSKKSHFGGVNIMGTLKVHFSLYGKSFKWNCLCIFSIGAVK